MAQVGAQHGFIGADFCRGPNGQDFTLNHHHDAVTKTHHKIHVVLNHHKTATFFFIQGFEQSTDFTHE